MNGRPSTMDVRTPTMNGRTPTVAELSFVRFAIMSPEFCNFVAVNMEESMKKQFKAALEEVKAAEEELLRLLQEGGYING